MGKSRNHFITNSIRIKNEKIFLNKETVLSFDSEIGFPQFLKDSYKKLGLKYPKYHKMDSLCKLGILGSSVLLKDQNFDADTALVFSNTSASHDIDLKHKQSMESIVSPTVFVYTLPNIVLGEISIKYKLQSENVFFIEDKFNAELLWDYSEALLNSGKVSSVVCGWIELKNEQYDVLLCLVSNNGEIPFTKDNLEELYKFENE
ncbi:hypothetical protein JM83_3003 [Gillisia sp. Hel_I_86]|uniref:hypothetical protein n=1 Tax=Gillisia sp. Hel_I_86 TaxID=1249981 RepID=UPI00119910F5|nr:hypothetical protein [Gillisia sp. Hel_I_86]TVZ27923.1 hypothetical protein JM83_3003 [Gillisia sp. Hel_I_86]